MLACGHIAAERERDDPATVIAAAKVAPGQRVLDVSTETGEAALAALPIIGTSGRVIGTDIAPGDARSGAQSGEQTGVFTGRRRRPEIAVRRRFDAVVCQLGLQFFSDPALGLREFRRVLRTARRSASSLPRTARRCGVPLPR